MTELILRADPTLSRPLTERLLVVGRAAGCDLVLVDEAVSGRHAAFWVDDGGVWVRDLGSRNGVRVDGEAVVGDRRVPPGAEVVVGETVLVVRAAADAAPGTMLVVEDVATGIATPFLEARVHLGGGGSALLRVAGAAEVVLLRVDGDEVLLGRDDDMTPLPLDTPFAVGDRQFVVRRVRAERPPTRELGPPLPTYRLEATLEGGPGPKARVIDVNGAGTLEVAAENRATLFWLLGQRWLQDPAGDGRGWVAEPELLTGVWGRAAGATPNNLRVLVCRIRRDLREAGLDPWMLEHRAGHLRVRVRDVALV